MFRFKAKVFHNFATRFISNAQSVRRLQTLTHSLQLHLRPFNRSNDRQESNDLACLVAAPTFLAFFKKKDEDDDEDLSFLEKLIPKEIRILLQKEDESPHGRLVMTLKRSIYLMQQNKMDKAEQVIHLALRMAQDMQHRNAITLCFDIMANLALERQQYEKAEKLFVAVLQRLLQAGTEQDDIKVLHISLKIAQIAEYTSMFDKANQGYQWVLENLERKYKKETEDKDLYELIALASNMYVSTPSNKVDVGKSILHFQLREVSNEDRQLWQVSRFAEKSLRDLYRCAWL